MSERFLIALQRLSAMILAPLVIIHLVLILIAVRDGLTAAEILGRTQGSAVWAVFYGAFVVMAAIHAPIGLRSVLVEWSVLPRNIVNPLMLIFALLLFAVGMRAVVAVIGGGA